VLALVPFSVRPDGRSERYFDLATGTEVDKVVDVPATGADVLFTNDRVWYALGYAEGVRSLDEMRELVG